MIDDEKLKDYIIPENYNHGFMEQTSAELNRSGRNDISSVSNHY